MKFTAFGNCFSSREKIFLSYFFFLSAIANSAGIASAEKRTIIRGVRARGARGAVPPWFFRDITVCPTRFMDLTPPLVIVGWGASVAHSIFHNPHMKKIKPKRNHGQTVLKNWCPGLPCCTFISLVLLNWYSRFLIFTLHCQVFTWKKNIIIKVSM